MSQNSKVGFVVWEGDLDRCLALLQRVSDEQSKRDGIDRPKVGQFTTHQDQFTQDINLAATQISVLRKLMPMHIRLTALGRKLYAEGKINLDWGDDFAEAALDYVLAQHGIEADK